MGKSRPAPVWKWLGWERCWSWHLLLSQNWVPGSDPRRSSQSARAPWRPDPGAGARRPRDSGDPLPATLQGRPHPEVILSNISPCVPAPTLPSLLKLLCPLAPRPVLRACSRGAVLASERAARFASAGAHFLPFPGPGRLRGGWRSARVLAFGAAERPPRPEAPGAGGLAPASEPETGRDRGRAVIASRGTMPTFEPLTTKQTALGLSLHSKQGLLTGVSQQRIATGAAARRGGGKPRGGGGGARGGHSPRGRWAPLSAPRHAGTRDPLLSGPQLDFSRRRGGQALYPQLQAQPPEPLPNPRANAPPGKNRELGRCCRGIYASQLRWSSPALRAPPPSRRL